MVEANSKYSLLNSVRQHFRRRLFAAFIAAYFVAGTAFGMMALVLPVHAVRMDTPAWLIGILQASLALGVMLTILPAGFLVDKYGSRRLFLLGAVATGLLSMTVPMIGKFPLLMAVVMLIGGFHSFAAASLNAAFFSNQAKIGADRASWYKGAWMAGLALAGPTLAGGTIRVLSAPIVFYLIGGFWLLQALVAAILTGRANRRRANDVAPPITRLKDLAASRQLIGASMLEGLSVTTVGIFSTFVSIVVIRKFDLTAPYIALLISLQGIGYASTLIWGAGIARRLSEFRLRASGSTGVALTFLIFALAPSFFSLAVASLFLGLSLGLLGLTNLSPLTESNSDRGSVAGFYGFGANTFAFTGTLAAGLVGHAHGPVATLLPVPALHVAVILFMLYKIFRHNRSRKERRKTSANPRRSFSLNLGVSVPPLQYRTP